MLGCTERNILHKKKGQKLCPPKQSLPKFPIVRTSIASQAGMNGRSLRVIRPLARFFLKRVIWFGNYYQRQDRGSDQGAQNQIWILKTLDQRIKTLPDTGHLNVTCWSASENRAVWCWPCAFLEDAVTSEGRDRKGGAFVHGEGMSNGRLAWSVTLQCDCCALYTRGSGRKPSFPGKRYNSLAPPSSPWKQTGSCWYYFILFIYF